jgi:Spy/CpxP family protein refolding chaperone
MTMNRILGGRWMLAGLLAVTAGAAGVTGAAIAQGGGAMHRMHGGSDPAAMEARFDKMIAQMVPDATPEQKSRLKAIAGPIHADFGAVHAQFHQAHQRAHAMLLAPTVDRAGLERLRAEQIRQLDTVSRRMVNAMADAAEVLTPEQRAGLAEHLKTHKH